MYLNNIFETGKPHLKKLVMINHNMCATLIFYELMVKNYKTAHGAKFDLPARHPSVAAFGGPTSL
jgi:hypothetical protein